MVYRIKKWRRSFGWKVPSQDFFHRVQYLCIFSIVSTLGVESACIPLRWSGSGSGIRDHSDHSTSKEMTNPSWKRVHQVIWCTMIPSDLPSWAVVVSCCNASVFCSPTSSRFSTLNDPLLRPLAKVSSVFRADGWGDCGRPAARLKDLTLALSCSSSYHCSAYGESYKKLLLYAP